MFTITAREVTQLVRSISRFGHASRARGFTSSRGARQVINGTYRNFHQEAPSSHLHKRKLALPIQWQHEIGTVKLFSSQAQRPQKTLLASNPTEFLGFLKENNIKRCFIIYDKNEKKLVASHEELQEFADFFSKDLEGGGDFKEHEGIFMNVGLRTECLLGAFVWRTCRGQACGGIRLWQYTDMESYLRDGLRLAFGMGVKSALAGLWAGGGKGVVAEPHDQMHRDPSFRQKLFYDYGDFLTSLNGCYVAAEDLGLTVTDLDCVHTRTRYTTCIREELGGSGNPSVATGLGVVCAMDSALNFLKMGSLEGKSVAIQGAGNVAVVIIEELIRRKVDSIYVTDVHQKRVDDVQDHFANKLNSTKLMIEKVPLDDNSVLGYPCDIVSPCALGNVLREDTIGDIRAKIVCGAANNQLGSGKDSQTLVDRGVTYVPDFLANRMGIVNCANETYGRLPDDPAIYRHFGNEWDNSIYVMTQKILERARDEGITPETAAMQIADKMSKELHPIWPNRSQQIIDNLVAHGWQHGNDFWRDAAVVHQRSM